MFFPEKFSTGVKFLLSFLYSYNQSELTCFVLIRKTEKKTVRTHTHMYEVWLFKNGTVYHGGDVNHVAYIGGDSL